MTRAAPGIRILPAPESDPPYEDVGAVPTARWHPNGEPAAPCVQGTLALSFELPSGAPTTPHAPATLRLVAGREDRHDPDAALATVRPLAGKLAQALVEVLGGVRPVAQLVQWTSADVYDTVKRRADAPGGWPPRGKPSAAARVHSIRLSLPTDDVAEIAAVVRGGGRARAMALRLEGSGKRWRCTQIELG